MDYYYANGIINTLKNASQLVVFGAGNVAHLVVGCLKSEPYRLPIEYCMVSNAEGNPKEIEGVPVIDYDGAKSLVNPQALILIAIVEKYLDSVEKGLRDQGFSNTLLITYENDLWSLLRGNCYRAERLSKGKSYLTVEEELDHFNAAGDGKRREKSICVYRACCHVDKKLEEDISRFSWETPIQVGAALTDIRICEICDDQGENISGKNKKYCELTALYWIWKHDKSDYVGLGHYRRHFELDEEQLKKISGSDIDMVLTIPIMDMPDVETVYRRDHIGEDWDIMVEAVERLAPNYLDTIHRMGKGKYYYAYNMFIMRREILEDYCQWLFPILFYCEEHCRDKEDAYQNRYIGFLAEHLMSAYVLYHEEEYKIVHARKHFVIPGSKGLQNKI